MDESKKKIGNPMWIAGGKSPNPEGARKHSVRTIPGMIERLIKREFSPNKMHKIIAALTAQQKADMYIKLVPYVVAPKRADSLTTDEIEQLYSRLEETITNAQQKKIS